MHKDKYTETNTQRQIHRDRDGDGHFFLQILYTSTDPYTNYTWFNTQCRLSAEDIVLGTACNCCMLALFTLALPSCMQAHSVSISSEIPSPSSEDVNIAENFGTAELKTWRFHLGHIQNKSSGFERARRIHTAERVGSCWFWPQGWIKSTLNSVPWISPSSAPR